MKPLPKSDKTLLIRTDFSDDGVWKNVCGAVRAPDPELKDALSLFAQVNEALGQPLGDFDLPLQIVDDREYRDLTAEALLKLVPKRSNYTLLLVVDAVTMSNPEHPVLVVDLGAKPGRSFRSVPSQIFAIESNLSIANMDWEEFSCGVSKDGIFRGFRK